MLLYSPPGRPGLQDLLAEQRITVTALPLLETPYPAVERRLELRALDLGLPHRALVDVFPTVPILKEGLITADDYWVGLVANWVDAGATEPAKLEAAITPLLRQKRVGQKLRHRLGRLLGPRPPPPRTMGSSGGQEAATGQ